MGDKDRKEKKRRKENGQAYKIIYFCDTAGCNYVETIEIKNVHPLTWDAAKTTANRYNATSTKKCPQCGELLFHVPIKT